MDAWQAHHIDQRRQAANPETERFYAGMNHTIDFIGGWVLSTIVGCLGIAILFLATVFIGPGVLVLGAIGFVVWTFDYYRPSNRSKRTRPSADRYPHI
jgi:hypothetical protein